ncbi:MAG: glucose-1-phosphate adenylyltransferase [Candidatus Cloacimonetes bacterium 4572_55]|nr:MAG: glucose-1-phosphate adenylyltransferase [Candidatus Cloacimonetes bacterium 4572_55]
MRNVVSIILGGGRGSRLYPLTLERAKPAVPLAGKYRLIDIPLSNCINSGIRKIYVLTQFNSVSLNNHITKTYRFSNFSSSFVEILAAQQTSKGAYWFEGTADAVRRNLTHFEKRRVKDYLILSGDHLYCMNYSEFIARHRDTKADVSLSVLPVTEEQTSSFGLLKINDSGRVIDFKEKPTGDELKSMQVDTKILGLNPESANKKPYIASMGIYIFKPDLLAHLLKESPTHTDFGREVIPEAIHNHKVQSYMFNDYWEDIGTVESFYKSNMELVKHPSPTFSFFRDGATIFTRPRLLPPNKILDAHITESMLTEGSVIKKAEIHRSIIGIRSRIDTGCLIEDSLLMGIDFNQSLKEREADLASGIPPYGIGKNSHIKKTIIDRNVRIGQNVSITNKSNMGEYRNEKNGYCISNGIVIVLKGAIIPDNTVI